MASLSIDKTGLSRLISSANKIPRVLIEAIGPAPKAGRDRWIELATRLEAEAGLRAAYRAIESDTFATKDTDDRFAAVFNAAAPRKAKVAQSTLSRAADGTRIARISEDEVKLSLAIDKKGTGAFAAFLVETLPDIYAAFKRREDQQPATSTEKDRTD